jgi:hypothetical protein
VPGFPVSAGAKTGTGTAGAALAPEPVPDFSRFCEALDLRSSSGSRGQWDMPGIPAPGATSQENGTGSSPRSDQACACPGFPSSQMEETGHWSAGFSRFRRGENQSLISQRSTHERSFLQSPFEPFRRIGFSQPVAACAEPPEPPPRKKSRPETRPMVREPGCTATARNTSAAARSNRTTASQALDL